MGGGRGKSGQGTKGKILMGGLLALFAIVMEIDGSILCFLGHLCRALSACELWHNCGYCRYKPGRRTARAVSKGGTVRETDI